jgi:hypothetical protein
MARTKDLQYELNQEFTTRAVFMEWYNVHIPSGFPRVTVDMLKKFQTSHPMLFKEGNSWSVDKHRKRLMDWLVSNRGVA